MTLLALAFWVLGAASFALSLWLWRGADRILDDALDEADAAEAMLAEARRLHDAADDWWKP